MVVENTLILQLVLFIVLAFITCFCVIISRIILHRRLPPGPRASLLGLGDHSSLVGRSRIWELYEKWGGEYGPIMSYRLGNTPVIVLNKAKIAWDLLEKRGDIFSSRPRNVMATELYSGGLRGSMMPYGDRWRRWRKIQHIGMSGRQAITYRHFQTLESTVYLHGLLESPDRYMGHFARFAISVVMSISYGTRVESLEDQLIKDNLEAISDFGRFFAPGRWLVNSYPILLNLPRTLQWFRHEPERLRYRTEALYVRLLRGVADRMSKGIARECSSTRMLNPKNKDGSMSEAEMAWAVTSPFSAGVETTTSTLTIFIMAMLLHPEIMKKAQDEIDEVVGRDRAPNFEDEKSLPYIVALIKEVTRWIAVAPTGVPHSTTEDSEYNGFFIPKGTSVYANIHHMTRDPEIFPEPHKFRPERFLGVKDPRLTDFNLPFGFGRRICPGMHVASQSLYIIITRTLWAFDICPELDSTGSPILPDPDNLVEGIVLSPMDFPCQFIPRDYDVGKIIRQDMAEAVVELEAWAS